MSISRFANDSHPCDIVKKNVTVDGKRVQIVRGFDLKTAADAWNAQYNLRGMPLKVSADALEAFGLDASPSAGGSVNSGLFLSRQLEELDIVWHEQVLPGLEADILSPKAVGEGRDVFKWQQHAQSFRHVTNADEHDWTGLLTGSSGFSGSYVAENIDTFIGLAQITDGELRAAANNTMPYEPAMFRLIKDEMLLAGDAEAMIGNAGTGVKGLFQTTGTETITLPDHASTSDGRWYDSNGALVKTADEIMNDLRLAVTSLDVKTNGRFKTSHLFISKRLFNYIKGLPVNASFPLFTVYKWFQENFSDVKLVDSRYLGIVSTTFPDAKVASVLVAIDNKPTNMQRLISLPPIMLPPQFLGTTSNFFTKARYGGTAVYQSRSVCICKPSTTSLEET